MTERWNYGDLYKKWPIAEGEIWHIDNHIVACGDVDKGQGQSLLKQTGRPHMTYVDPPWNQGNYRAFHTKAGILDKELHFTDFLERLIKLIKVTKGDVYIEMGVKSVEELTRIIKENDGSIKDTWNITYYHKNLAKLIRCTWNKSEDKIGAPLMDGYDDESTPRIAITYSTSMGARIFDPCAGRGLTPSTAASLGRRSISMELNPKRAANIIENLYEIVRVKPKKIGELN
jgi:hypothetical protein